MKSYPSLARYFWCLAIRSCEDAHPNFFLISRTMEFKKSRFFNDWLAMYSGGDEL